MNTLTDLKVKWMRVKAAEKLAYQELCKAALEMFDWKVGDTVEVVRTDRRKVRGRIGEISISVNTWINDTPTLELRPVVYPERADGTLTKVGEIMIFAGDLIRLVERSSNSVENSFLCAS